MLALAVAPAVAPAVARVVSPNKTQLARAINMAHRMNIPYTPCHDTRAVFRRFRDRDYNMQILVDDPIGKTRTAAIRGSKSKAPGGVLVVLTEDTQDAHSMVHTLVKTHVLRRRRDVVILGGDTCETSTDLIHFPTRVIENVGIENIMSEVEWAVGRVDVHTHVSIGHNVVSNRNLKYALSFMRDCWSIIGVDTVDDTLDLFVADNVQTFDFQRGYYREDCYRIS